ncbi:hypothetical protein Tco_0866774 [Tanacetum coccineum]
MVKAQRGVGFCAKILTKEAQMHPKENDTLAILRLTYTGDPSVLEGYTDASWISNTKYNSSTSGWVFLLGGGAISWASKKHTCITGSTMKSELVFLAAVGKEAKWLKNLLLEFPLWSKPIAPISIHYDSAATLAKAYSQMYNGKSRHLGVRHRMIREMIMNGVISIEFVRLLIIFTLIWDTQQPTLLAEDQAWMELCSDSDQELSANMVFMAKMEKILSDLKESSSFEKETLAEASYYSYDSESEYEFGETSDYYDKFETNYALFVDNEDDQEIFHDAIELVSHP